MWGWFILDVARPEEYWAHVKDRDFFKDPRLDSGDEGAIGSDGSSVTATASDFLVTSISVLE